MRFEPNVLHCKYYLFLEKTAFLKYIYKIGIFKSQTDSTFPNKEIVIKKCSSKCHENYDKVTFTCCSSNCLNANATYENVISSHPLFKPQKMLVNILPLMGLFTLWE